ncbi:pyridoxamine 5'-phosphate oxidase family protein [Herbiconiux sp. VKM Ac-2851]|uniref:pyridoxamine 5'-phosphate oxidase family protein n=1 Tax=Herbiconiux sp. VKM Ac-2851 TaxID=2739025 RepID=UPI001563841E|nr:pyridoxamine 5'-phosphate oxidase family protein [Herbiconiux sp. VKM Ac-2851]NQX37161.1 pyridoxamine 5'-phosphate oxidase family protein [Herbiconiux sp. VKM Ac-2851]
MSRQYGCIAFTDTVSAEQESYGSAEFYGRGKADCEDPAPETLGDREKHFLESRDSFYLASVGETGWPYVQFRGGPAGFIRVNNGHSLAWADYRGNLQHITTGNLRTNDRIAIIAMDYPRRRRLKIYGTAQVTRYDENPALVERLVHPDDTEAVAERAIIVTVNAFDWNCPQHITPRYTADEIGDATEALRSRVSTLERKNAQLRRQLSVMDATGAAAGSPLLSGRMEASND